MVERNKIILFIITDFGSFNNFLSELSLHIIDNYPYHIHVICSSEKVINFSDKFNFQREGLTFHFIEIPRGYNVITTYKASRAIYDICEKIGPDLIHAHFTTGIFPTLFFKRPTAEIWGTFHGVGYIMSAGLKKAILFWIETYCFSRLNKIFVLNKSDNDLINNRFKPKTQRYQSLGLGCDINKFNPDLIDEQLKGSLRQSLGINDQIVLSFTGRFVEFKGFHILVRAFIRLQEKYPDKFKLILMGGKDKAHPTGLSKMEENLVFNSEEIINIGFTNEVENYLALSDIFVFPSKKEGVPICVLEALSMCLPVIAFNVRGCNDLILPNKNGILIEPTSNVDRDTNEFVSAIENLVFNPARLTALSENSRDLRDSYSRKNFITEQTNYYVQKIENGH